MQFRDEIVDLGYTALYPCPKSELCPMLKRSRDWCFSEAYWQVPEIQARIDRLIPTDRRKLNVTAFGFFNGTIEMPKTPPKVIVGRPTKAAKGKERQQRGPGYELLICNGDSLEKRPGRGNMPLRGTSI